MNVALPTFAVWYYWLDVDYTTPLVLYLVVEQDPRIEAVFKGYPIVDPREVATAILFLASDSKAATKINGETYVVGNSLESKAWGCPSLAGPPLKPGSCCADSSPQPWQ